MTYHWQWDLRSSPEELWPHVSDTERFNKVVGLPEPTFTDLPHEGGGTRRVAEANQVGMVLRWKEHPYEWLAPRWMGVLREYDNGPVRSVRTNVALTPREGGGTRLDYSIEVRASGLVGRVVQGVEFTRLQAAMERAFLRIDEKIREREAAPSWHLDLDPFESPVDQLESRGSQRLEAAMGRLRGWRLPDPALAERIGQLVRFGPDHVVERIRPLKVARDWKAPADHVIDTCLIAAHVGVLELSWSVLCPSCRSSATDAPKLSRLAPTTHCEACDIDFDLEFVESVELSFRPAASIRRITPGTYCLGGPAHKPSASAQVWLQPGEEREVTLGLGSGSWRLSGPRLRGQGYLDPVEGEGGDPLAIDIGADALPIVRGKARPGDNTARIRNDSPWDQVVRVERAAWRDDAVTAAEAMTRATFRQLFSADVLTPGTHVDVGQVAILFTDLQGSTAMYEQVGDAAAYAMVRRHFEVIDEVVARHRGAIVKTIGDAVMAAWCDPLDAVVAALSLQTALSEHPDTAHLHIKAGVHFGRCIGVTVGGTFDYFGTTVNTAARLERVAGAGEVAISADLASEATVATWMMAHPDTFVRRVDERLKGLSGTHACTVLSGQPVQENLRSTRSLDIVRPREA